jgi:cytosine/adenosine deaminase-related metal-dependent hydrolase
MRIISADILYPIHQNPIKDGSLIFDQEGRIIEVLDYKHPDAKHYNGIVCPGFVNVHCHLELSFAYQQIMEKTGIDGFIGELEMAKRNFTPDIKLEAIAWADQQMRRNGIVAVGDIMNTPLSLETKSSSAIQYHNFIETYGSDTTVAESRFQHAQELLFHAGPKASIVPHAPYSMSEELFEAIHQNQKSIQSIHYAESTDEYLYFEKAEGKIYDRLKKWGVKIPSFIPSGKSPIQSIQKWLHKKLEILFIHNTFITQEDIDFILDHFEKPFFGLCPNANLFIEDKLPNITQLINNEVNICLGTDSLASNHELSILSEIKTLQHAFPALETEDLLKWGTLNGANALGLSETLGSFEKGKKPGILQINEDFTRVRRIDI